MLVDFRGAFTVFGFLVARVFLAEVCSSLVAASASAESEGGIAVLRSFGVVFFCFGSEAGVFFASFSLVLVILGFETSAMEVPASSPSVLEVADLDFALRERLACTGVVGSFFPLTLTLVFDLLSAALETLDAIFPTEVGVAVSFSLFFVLVLLGLAPSAIDSPVSSPPILEIEGLGFALREGVLGFGSSVAEDAPVSSSPVFGVWRTGFFLGVGVMGLVALDPACLPFVLGVFVLAWVAVADSFFAGMVREDWSVRPR